MRNFAYLLLTIMPFSAMAQSENLMYSEGTIYVVVAVIAIIFLGLAGYLYRMDRKVTALENEK